MHVRDRYKFTMARVSYRFSYAMRHNDANKMTPHPVLYASFQNFNKMDGFPKFFLKIFILGNLIVGWGEGFIKEGAGILHQIHRFSGVFIVGAVGFIKVKVGII